MRYRLQKESGEFALIRSWSAAVIRYVTLQRLDHRICLIVIIVAQNVRGKAGMVIDIFMSVGIPQTRTFGTREGNNRVCLAVKRGQTSRNKAAVFCKQLL